MNSNPFSFFNLPLSFELNEKTLEEMYYELSKTLHPDRHGKESSENLMEIQRKSAELNHAYKTLKKPLPRLDCLFELSGLISKSVQSKKGSIPIELAEEYFEIQESLTDAPQPAKINSFIEKLGKLLEEKKHSIFSKAKTITWDHPDKCAEEIQSLHAERQELSYLESLIDNTKRILQ